MKRELEGRAWEEENTQGEKSESILSFLARLFSHMHAPKHLRSSPLSACYAKGPYQNTTQWLSGFQISFKGKVSNEELQQVYRTDMGLGIYKSSEVLY